MYIHATPGEFESAPVHGAYSADAPRVSIGLRLELTQEEAASVLATFTVGLHKDPGVTPVDAPQIVGQILTDVVLQTIREATTETLEGEEGYPELAGFYDWYRRLVGPAVPQQRSQNETTPALAGTAVA